jgi:ketosteroid isomerase-like protein
VTQELVEVAHAWDRAMITNDAEAIGRFMAEDWVIIEQVSCVFVKRDDQWQCVLTHLSRLASG